MKITLRTIGYLFLIFAVWDFITLRKFLGLDWLVFGVFCLLLSVFAKDERKHQRFELSK